jgi:hypothetical protein
MSIDVLDRIHKLLALVASDGLTEEARTAAVIACKLIKDNNVILVCPDAETEENVPDTSEYDLAVRKGDLLWREYASSYRSKCRECGLRVEVGEPVQWSLGYGVWHLYCWNDIPSNVRITPLDLEKAVAQREHRLRRNSKEKVQTTKEDYSWCPF